MNATIPEITMGSLSARVAALTGLHYPPSRWGDLQRNVERASAALGFEHAEACVEWLLTAPPTRRLRPSSAST